jgi:hypothetical protein
MPTAGGGDPLLDSFANVYSTIIGLIYPVIVLIFMLSPNVARSFYRRDEPMPPGGFPEQDEFGYERPYGREDF